MRMSFLLVAMVAAFFYCTEQPDNGTKGNHVLYGQWEYSFSSGDTTVRISLYLHNDNTFRDTAFLSINNRLENKKILYGTFFYTDWRLSLETQNGLQEYGYMYNGEYLFLVDKYEDEYNFSKIADY